ncbi:efflux RND transporter periplasmic adaptor subunit [Bosea sp. (in: a-proteobacteria)]|jgi:multidrug efflux system membrane fusion protein|uniref:efflux RND transporter periplasmic adaptor subunit n=1 Tax=Bosea sp. (in: a-proteobacteria) TaxID=1871050 RepID=UPI002DDCDE60|nr:efflux RND transporter periplasmic adaptor subunit [Bosea sp. (in: a-proteobacteria)]HEV2508792.1 efflux RND transporter periplasmic adaptor subunit [Bosea sp. (in: a-proteobacteria)]
MKRLLILLVLLGAAAWGWHSYNGGWMPGGEDSVAAGQQGGGRGGRRARFGNNEGPIPVIATPARYGDVPVTADAVGTIQALNTVTVRTQVDGRLIEIAFKDGQDIRKGDLLARIDPTTYQAQYDQAMAKKAQDEAQLANARADLERYAKLAQTDYGSRQQADTQRATVAQLEALVRSDQGAIDNAKAYLDYTTIRAPIDGRLGIRQVDQGNIVRASDSNGLVVITQLKPIAMIFNLPQQQLRAVSAAVARGPVEVDALDSDGTTIIDKGVVEVIDNVVDQTTGTIKVKARFPNERLQLWPGQFVNVRVFVDVLRHVVVAPTAAIQRGPNGAYVFAVNEDETVRQVTVTVGQQDETTAVITAGVEPPAKLVTTGFARLTDKARVRVSTPEEAAQPPAAMPGRRSTREPGQGQGQGQRRQRDRAAGDAGGAGSAAPAPDATGGPPAGSDGSGQNRPRRNGGAREGAAPGGQGSPAGGSGAQRPQAQP